MVPWGILFKIIMTFFMKWNFIFVSSSLNTFFTINREMSVIFWIYFSILLNRIFHGFCKINLKGDKVCIFKRNLSYVLYGFFIKHLLKHYKNSTIYAGKLSNKWQDKNECRSSRLDSFQCKKQKVAFTVVSILFFETRLFGFAHIFTNIMAKSCTLLMKYIHENTF